MPAQLLNFPQQPQSQGKAGAVADPDDDGDYPRSDHGCAGNTSIT